MLAQNSISRLIYRLESIREELVSLEGERGELIASAHESHRRSAANLLHYVTLRRHDLRSAQQELAKMGLSSLGRCEQWVLGNLDAVISALYAMESAPVPKLNSGCRVTMAEGQALMDANAARLLGKTPDRNVRIMVTMPREAADDYLLIRDLVRAGMNVMRINCAHDDEFIWEQMIENRNKACGELKTECRVYMDLAGPNPRTVIPGGEIKGRRFNVNDRFVLSDDPESKHVPQEFVDLPRIYCSLPEVVDDLEEGQRVLINDGKLTCRVAEVKSGCALLYVTASSSARGKKLKAEKGINLPDTDLNVPSLTEDDLTVLPFVAEHADMVGYSFVREATDVEILQEKLDELGGNDPGIVLKIETVSAFRNLPSLLFTAMRRPRLGVMIARGDLAVEAGYERMSEIQEEVLWFCEAAHVPVIWATQVLQTFVKEGLPGRGEITDAAMGGRAECVMLNKGPHTVKAVETLDNILTRMRGHQEKKRSLFRPLSVSTTFDGRALTPGA